MIKPWTAYLCVLILRRSNSISTRLASWLEGRVWSPSLLYLILIHLYVFVPFMRFVFWQPEPKTFIMAVEKRDAMFLFGTIKKSPTHIFEITKVIGSSESYFSRFLDFGMPSRQTLLWVSIVSNIHEHFLQTLKRTTANSGVTWSSVCLFLVLGLPQWGHCMNHHSKSRVTWRL